MAISTFKVIQLIFGLILKTFEENPKIQTAYQNRLTVLAMSFNETGVHVLVYLPRFNIQAPIPTTLPPQILWKLPSKRIIG